MSESSDIQFVDLDPATGQHTPTTYESMRASIQRRHSVLESVPDDIGDLLHAAIDYVALAYEQASSGRVHLYERLTNDAFVKAVLALEMALRQCLGRGNRVRLEELISKGIEANLLPSSNEYAQVWTELRENRNAIAHGDPDRSSYGPSTVQFIGVVIDTLNAIYSNAQDYPSLKQPGISSHAHDDVSKA